jgi:hypothetical protein
MAWSNVAFAGHEGFLVGFVRDQGGVLYELGELGYPDGDRAALTAHAFVVACNCGWRSPRMLGHPAMRECERFEYEQAARTIWHRHVLRDAPDMRVSTSGVLEASALEVASLYEHEVRP